MPDIRYHVKENRDYMLIPDPNDDRAYAVKLQDGSPYAGIQYRYLTVNIEEKPPVAELNFTYEIIAGDQEIITSTEDFQSYVASVLHSILIDSFNNAPESVEMKDQNGHRITDFDSSSLGEKR